jgi:hypothetical protein
MTASLELGSSEMSDGMDLSFCRLDNSKKVLQFSGANHSAFIIRKKSNLKGDETLKERMSDTQFVMYTLEGVRRPIGKSYSHKPFTCTEFDVMLGDRIVLFSDGYADQIGGIKGKKMKKASLLKHLLNTADLSLDDQKHQMKEQFLKWKGELQQVDDVCLMLVEVI